MITPILFMLAFLHFRQDALRPTPPMLDQRYMAAKYSMVMDFTDIQDLVPMLDTRMTSYAYYIQYGDSLVIEIKDPGDRPYLPTMVVAWDYGSCNFTPDIYFKQVKKYYKGIDTITFDIEENRGVVHNLCEQGRFSPQCDSVKYTKQDSNQEYLIYVNDTIANVKSYYLFYPDIQYLPYKIVTNGKRKTIRNLEEIIYGKQAIDSLLQLYQHFGYERIPDEEWKSAGDRLPIEVKETLKLVQDRLKE
jgi:hypothetical protein